MTTDLQQARLEPRAHTRASVEELARRYSTWGRWGADDELGAANHVTQETVRHAAGLVRRGAVFPLALPLEGDGPQLGAGGRVNPQHVMLRTPAEEMFDDGGLVRFSDDAVYMALQCSTQWDALCHIFYDGQAYNGRDFSSVGAVTGARHNSITNLTDRAAGRGVLLDVGRFVGRELEPGESIQREHLEACAQAQGVQVGTGDFVLVRTGQMTQRRGAWGDFSGGPAPGLGVSTADFLCPRDVVAVATDTWGIEALPYEAPDVVAPLHVILLAYAGIYIGEMWDLDALAADCAADGVYEFFLTAPPLTITGSVGSPITPLAIK
ncbi:cyclase [Pseudonocardia sulfidoxydans NBRC 16205]|uniref:Cyclase n=2 Tax=Pseudonocardia sulfidoxydans TaxID=54011 RepID=A0A511DHH9_9PSEU|nr:cyclase family protein [Pseudonocardia sulfidoxydans]GEL24241.1 cyclase [Pseudonocardia sulfidoxydans NBRC 16205]